MAQTALDLLHALVSSQNIRYALLQMIVIMLMSTNLSANVSSTTNEIRFVLNNSDHLATLTGNGLRIGDSGLPSSNLHISGNAIITETLSVGSSQNSSSNLYLSGTQSFTPISLSSNATLDLASIYLIDTSLSNIHLTLPYAANVSGRIISVKQTSTLNQTIISSYGTSIDSETHHLLQSSGAYPSAKFISGNSSWHILNSVGGGSIASDNLRAYFPLEGTSANIARNLGSIAVTGDYENFATSEIGVSGKEGKAAEFDSTDNRINYGNTNTDLRLTFPFTLSAWINLSSLPPTDSDWYGIMGKYNSSSNREYALYIDNVSGIHKLTAYISSTGGSSGADTDIIVSTKSFVSGDLNQWFHVVFKVDVSGNYSLLINGAVDQSGVLAETSIFAGTSKFYIGAVHRSTGAPSRFFHGKIDGVRIYNKALSDSEIFMLYQSSSSL